MYNITSARGKATKKSSPMPFGKDKHFERSSSPTKKPASPKFTKEVSCAYCKAKGHIKADCFKLKRKNQSLTKSVTVPTSTAVAAAEEVTHVKQSADSLEDSVVIGHVSEDSLRHLKISDSVVEINSINGTSCSLLALMDTGSPVSFIQFSIFIIFFGENFSPIGTNSNSFRALNNTPKNVIGTQETNIELAVLPDISAKVNLRVIDHQTWSTHIVLDRLSFT